MSHGQFISNELPSLCKSLRDDWFHSKPWFKCLRFFRFTIHNKSWRIFCVLLRHGTNRGARRQINLIWPNSVSYFWIERQKMSHFCRADLFYWQKGDKIAEKTLKLSKCWGFYWLGDWHRTCWTLHIAVAAGNQVNKYVIIINPPAVLFHRETKKER